VPHKVTDESIAFFRDEIASFRDNLEKHFGVEITESRLRNAIGVYNETRGLLKRLYDLRQREKPPITGAECLNVVLAATTVPRDRYNQLLTRLLEELEQREEIPDYKARLMIVGSLYDDPAYTEIIEELGGLVVTDGLCFGSRYFWEPVEDGADLLGALSKSYMNRPSCPRMTNTAPQRLDFVRGMVERFRVDGIIFQRIRYCDVWGGELFHLRNKLGELGVPMLALEREYGLGSTEQLRTRVEAFLETIGR
jgi:benzoyl-CoA reductase/2-hydroxyglutaryl-CoA dehydratase subunit BcrC/BadD/HgdB